MQNHKISQRGLEQIKNFLMEHHRNYQGVKPENYQLAAWAEEAEQHADDGNGCYIEIPAIYSMQRKSQIFELPEDCFDVVEAEE